MFSSMSRSFSAKKEEEEVLGWCCFDACIYIQSSERIQATPVSNFFTSNSFFPSGDGAERENKQRVAPAVAGKGGTQIIGDFLHVEALELVESIEKSFL